MRLLTAGSLVRARQGEPKKQGTTWFLVFFIKLICGVYYGGDPPVPIPNTVVKPVRAENTWRAASRENRSMPQQKALMKVRALFIPYYKYFTPQAKPKDFGYSDASF